MAVTMVYLFSLFKKKQFEMIAQVSPAIVVVLVCIYLPTNLFEIQMLEVINMSCSNVCCQSLKDSACLVQLLRRPLPKMHFPPFCPKTNTIFRLYFDGFTVV